MDAIFTTADDINVPVGGTVYAVDGRAEVLEATSHPRLISCLRYSTRIAAAQWEVEFYERVRNELIRIGTEAERITEVETDIEAAKAKLAGLQES